LRKRAVTPFAYPGTGGPETAALHWLAVFDTLSDRLQGALGDLRKRGKLDEEAISRAMREVRLALLEADVNFEVVKDFVARVRERALGADVAKSLTPGQQVVKIVHEELTALMGTGDSKLAFAGRPPTVILLAGLQGSGKTTAAAKLALLLRKEGRKPALVAADLQRPAAIDQLEQLGRELQVPVFSEERADPVAASKQGLERARAEGLDTVVLDTAGRLHVDEELMDELVAVRDATRPTNVLLVLDSMTGQDAVRVAEAFAGRVAFDGVVLTKLDGDARGGAALSVKAVTGKPIKLVSVGERLDQLEYFHPDRMASRILGMGDVLSLIEKAEAAVEDDEREEMEKRMMQGEFTFDDFLRSYKMLRRMGPLQGVIKMIPGLGKQLEGLDDVDDRQLARVEAIVLSMTPHERRIPHVIDGSRRKRIASGSGTTVEEVNRLLEGRKQMEKLMKGMSKGKMPDLGALAGQSEATVPQPGQRKATKSNKRKKRQKSRR
jgi:signal recognition particle subunit SRP54